MTHKKVHKLNGTPIFIQIQNYKALLLSGENQHEKILSRAESHIREDPVLYPGEAEMIPSSSGEISAAHLWRKPNKQ